MNKLKHPSIINIEKIFENDVLGLKEYEAEKKRIVDSAFEDIENDFENKLKLKD